MPILTGAVLKSAQAGSLSALLAQDGYRVSAIYPYTLSDTPTAISGTCASGIWIAAQRALTGATLLSYFDDFYYRIHLLPQRINLGSLASE